MCVAVHKNKLWCAIQHRTVLIAFSHLLDNHYSSDVVCCLLDGSKLGVANGTVFVRNCVLILRDKLPAVRWCRNGCATSEDILWKLDALQTFVSDLHWPDEVFAEHISQRLQTMSNEMVEAAAKRSVLIRGICHRELGESTLQSCMGFVTFSRVPTHP